MPHTHLLPRASGTETLASAPADSSASVASVSSLTTACASGVKPRLSHAACEAPVARRARTAAPPWWAAAAWHSAVASSLSVASSHAPRLVSTSTTSARAHSAAACRTAWFRKGKIGDCQRKEVTTVESLTATRSHLCAPPRPLRPHHTRGRPATPPRPRDLGQRPGAAASPSSGRRRQCQRRPRPGAAPLTRRPQCWTHAAAECRAPARDGPRPQPLA